MRRRLPALQKPSPVIRYAPRESRPSHMAQQAAFAETPVPVLGDIRMVWDAVGKVKTTELPIGQVQMQLFTKAPRRADAKTVSHEKHPPS